MRSLKALLALSAVGALIAALTSSPVSAGTRPVSSARSTHPHINCDAQAYRCIDVNDPESVFGEDHYVGHDEPSTLFYSGKAGSGTQMRYQLTLPKDPPPNPIPGRSYNFQQHVAFWFGMAMCDTQSAPNTVNHCTPGSDANIVPPSNPNHPGTAFMEMQFYPPGWAPWPAGNSCDATKWCAALNIDSLSENMFSGKLLNDTCQGQVGIEPVNFAFITKNGKPQAPPSPINSTLATFTPDPSRDLFMSSGDKIAVTMHDTAHGLRIDLNDRTSGQSGFMVSSAANGFGQVKFAPNPSTECTNIPYDFHPMYSTSSEATRVPWAAHTYNISFADEIGHWDGCTDVPSVTGNCVGKEGLVPQNTDLEKADADDVYCFPASFSTLVKVPGCLGTNTGFDGYSYRQLWPDGNTRLHPTAIMFTSPLTGASYDRNYERAGLETDLPRIEFSTCDRFVTGNGCTHIPTTDDGRPANFYPFFSIGQSGGTCQWAIGNNIPGFTTNNFGGENQWGPLLKVRYISLHGTVSTRFNDFRNVMSNPCPATP